MTPGIHQLTNEQYHASEGIGKTGLDLFNTSPALVEWSRHCPRDTEVMAAEVGDALHAIVLEPERYAEEYVVAPECDRRTTIGKATYAAFVKESVGKIVLSPDEDRQLSLMKGSAMAHPTARFLMTAPGVVEESVFWTDEATGELCKYRSDKRLTDHHLLVDVKTVDDLDRFQRAIEEYRYWFQDGVYSEGYERHFGEAPGFLFLVFQKSRALNRYPVDVFELTPENKQQGRAEFRRLIDLYHDARVRDDWPGVRTIERPTWARN
jgi:exodeoxyribonuclease VIII